MGFRAGIQGWDSGSGFRVRILGQGSLSKFGSVFWWYLRVCFLVKGLKY
jgi:hypothetical protein